MRAAVISVISIALSAVVLGNAYFQKKQFYPSVVYITKSNPSMAVLYLQAFVLVILFGKFLRKVFFGQLRAAELEHLIEKSWYAVTETCLAFTVFRDDFSPKFVALFTVLLFLKCFHWLAEDRVDYMERSPVISIVFHGRVLSLLVVLGLLDGFFVNHAYYSTLTKGASVQLVFGFEYAILLTIIINIFLKYLLHTIDLQSENPWENKAVYLLYTELIMGFFKVILYVTFMAIMIKVHTFPLFAIRPMYLTMRSFKKALNDVIMSRRAIRNMNTLYPDATPEELEAADNVCIICREEMVTASKRLPCNHIFHTSCLRSWFQRQQTCPTCRMDVLRATPQRLSDNVPPQPPPPQAPHMPFGVFPGPFPLWPPPAQAGFPHLPFAQPPPQQRVQPNTVPNNQEGQATNQPTSQPHIPEAESNSTQIPPQFPSFFMPPMPFMPFAVPPPLPPPDLNLLSDDELRAMEGQDRQQVMARIQCLQNIQNLLDAAVAHMQQYTTIVSSLGSTNSTFPASGSNVTSDVNKSTKKASDIPSQSSMESVEDSSLLEGAVGYSLPAENHISDLDDIPGESDEQREIRRRRLQHFLHSSDQNQNKDEHRHSID